jgi:integrase
LTGPWSISADKMKMRRPHRVPLSRQSLALFEEAWEFSGGGGYVFPGVQLGTRPMSENTLNAALRRLGYSGSEMTSHGFRAMASTLLNEMGIVVIDPTRMLGALRMSARPPI